MSKRVKVFIVTYKRSDILADTLDRLFDSDMPNDVEVNVINNHSQFNLESRHATAVNVYHNVLRPDWSNGNLAENWNQAIVNGFKSLKKPDCDYVVTLQNDASVHENWFSNLMTMHEDFNFVVGQFGDNIVSYTPEAVRKIGLWDEGFTGVQYKEADYWLRALYFNRAGSMINDTLHGIELNNDRALPLDVVDGRNFVEEAGFAGANTLKRRADDSEHQEIWKTRGGYYKKVNWDYFVKKWSGTCGRKVEKNGWVKNWKSATLKSDTPDPTKSKVKIPMRYPYFEKDIDHLERHGYITY